MYVSSDRLNSIFVNNLRSEEKHQQEDDNKVNWHFSCGLQLHFRSAKYVLFFLYGYDNRNRNCITDGLGLFHAEGIRLLQ